MNKSTAWIVLLGIIIAAISGFAIGRMRGQADLINDVSTVTSSIDMRGCQNVQVGFDDSHGVIVPVASECFVDAFAQLGTDTYDSEEDAERALAGMVREYGALVRDRIPYIWHDETNGGTVYSLRIGFYQAIFADGFCSNATGSGVPCQVIPVTMVEL